jgi:hypothetical protein
MLVSGEHRLYYMVYPGLFRLRDTTYGEDNQITERSGRGVRYQRVGK